MAFFRIAFGTIMLCNVGRYFVHDSIGKYWIEPTFHFQYFGFEWVRPWPGNGMYVHFGVLGLAAAGITVGYFYRFCSLLFVVGFSFQFLLEQALYLNHYYAAALFSLLLAVVPANAVWSLDSSKRLPSRKSHTIPLWALWLLRFQIAVIYIFAGLAKLNPDWLSGTSWKTLLQGPTRVPFVDLLSEWHLANVSLGWGGLLFDLLVIPGLLWKRSRGVTFACAVVFHFINSQLFRIGIFPWMMLAATTLFFYPNWPRELLQFVTGAPHRIRTPAPASAPVSVPALTALVTYAVLQMAIPLRHYLYRGDVAWTEQGHRFSWRMMLHKKDGRTVFRVVTAQDTAVIDPLTHLRPWQVHAMSTRPDMILQYAHLVAREATVGRGTSVRVYVDAELSLNGRPPYPLVDPSIDLAAQPRTIWQAPWIIRSGGIRASWVRASP